MRLLPQENILYLGDTARVPYGTRSKEVITQFAKELTEYMLRQDVKMLVVACNTISATCLDDIKDLSPLPVIDVISPAVKRIITMTKNKRVGILGTSATIASQVYTDEIHKLDLDVTVIAKACPLFVPLVEEGVAESDIARLTAKYYLDGLNDIDTLHLGCTHYPLLKSVIQETVGDNVSIIDSAIPTAEAVKQYLTDHQLLNTSGVPAHYSFSVTDRWEKTAQIANIFLGTDITSQISQVTL